MISFYPGPSKVYPETGAYMQEALERSILSMNHRSAAFMDISRECILLLKQKLNIPESYSVFFTSSATEGWEIAIQSLALRNTYHIFNGAFGEKWFSYASEIVNNAEAIKFDINTIPEFTYNVVADDMICLTQNETSNGTLLPETFIAGLRKKFPQTLIACDATSSMAGVKTDYTQADVWIASVQKCFGLPAGLGIMICSPSAIHRALHLNRVDWYNSLVQMIERMQDWQTTYTPNVLNIFLLNKVMSSVKPIGEIDSILRTRADKWYEFISSLSVCTPLVQNTEVRSSTVIAVQAKNETVNDVKKKAMEKGLLIGNGYGEWKNSTFRIANFPALTEEDIYHLQEFLKNYSI